MEDKYICKECGAEVLCEEGKFIRSCEHTGTILLDMHVVATGESNCE
jgi:hypothetical protein